VRRPSASEPRAPRPLGDLELAGLLERLGPYETSPRLAVAVSGGPDSTALCLLADRWARARGGAVLALTVDHGLRTESREEAMAVGRWLGALGIRHEILGWTGLKPARALQAEARAARYALLAGRCRRAGILHLLLAHHRDDQAETVALRLARRSGPDGQAGMAPVREIAGLRLLRPLLGVEKARLIATLKAEGQPWLDDPSNRAPRFARSRLRAEGLDADALAARAASCASARAGLDRAAAAWLVAAARIDPAGFVLISAAALCQAPAPIARRVLLQALRVVGGNAYPPREVRLCRLLEALAERPELRGRTLAGCRILACTGDVLICREVAAIKDTIQPEAGVWHMWDRRFALRLSGDPRGLMLGPLGERGWRGRRRLQQVEEARSLPPPVGSGLPALWQGSRLVLVPHLGLRASDLAKETTLEVRLRPAHALAGADFACL
jgi:tRNA(Ile)-lysidine synthase